MPLPVKDAHLEDLLDTPERRRALMSYLADCQLAAIEQFVNEAQETTTEKDEDDNG